MLLSVSEGVCAFNVCLYRYPENNLMSFIVLYSLWLLDILISSSFKTRTLRYVSTEDHGAVWLVTCAWVVIT